MAEQFGTVVAVQRLSPSMIRITFGGDGLAAFEPDDATDQYVNALFVPDGAPYSAPFDVDEARASEPEHRPRGRRYTVRRWDAVERLLTVDFVAHGDNGFAGRWAQRASAGDVLQMTGPSGSYRPADSADWHLFVGDESALPGIGASLEVLGPQQRAVVIGVVDAPDHEIELPTDDAIDVRWVYRSTAGEPEQSLVDAVAALHWAPGVVDVFVHGEAGEVRAVRKFLVAERNVDCTTASISPYWRRDHTDEAWREVKREWLAAQAHDV